MLKNIVVRYLTARRNMVATQMNALQKVVRFLRDPMVQSFLEGMDEGVDISRASVLKSWDDLIQLTDERGFRGYIEGNMKGMVTSFMMTFNPSIGGELDVDDLGAAAKRGIKAFKNELQNRVRLNTIYRGSRVSA